MSDVPGAVLPLGVFGVVACQPDFAQMRGELLALAGAIPVEKRAPIVKYLRDGAIVFAFMEYTWDIIGGTLDKISGAFQVAGGSAVLTDGTYYWRSDAAEYVEHYGIGLPEEFLQYGSSLGWSAKPLTEEEVLTIDRYLWEHGRGLRKR